MSRKIMPKKRKANDEPDDYSSTHPLESDVEYGENGSGGNSAVHSLLPFHP